MCTRATATVAPSWPRGGPWRAGGGEGATLEALGGLDILVNNAGIQHVAAVDAFPDDTWDQLMAINVSAVFHTTKAALPGMAIGVGVNGHRLDPHLLASPHDADGDLAPVGNEYLLDHAMAFEGGTERIPERNLF